MLCPNGPVPMELGAFEGFPGRQGYLYSGSNGSSGGSGKGTWEMCIYYCFKKPEHPMLTFWKFSTDMEAHRLCKGPG